ncbi:MAG: hypothetical protein IRZ32_01400 [Solirubrobacteraceae bacterium]|nr:hypothetical protein [Solirubrobacteraceae bacterium]
MLAPAIAALPGWTTTVELPTAIGTVPLVAVGPAGVFAFEYADGTGVLELADTPEPALIDVWAQAKHLERRRIGGPVVPVLALEDTGADGPAGRRRGVRILPVEAVADWLAAQPAVLDEAGVDRLRRRLDGTDLPAVLAA